MNIDPGLLIHRVSSPHQITAREYSVRTFNDVLKLSDKKILRGSVRTIQYLRIKVKDCEIKMIEYSPRFQEAQRVPLPTNPPTQKAIATVNQRKSTEKEINPQWGELLLFGGR